MQTRQGSAAAVGSVAVGGIVTTLQDGCPTQLQPRLNSRVTPHGRLASLPDLPRFALSSAQFPAVCPVDCDLRLIA
jgi:hypothetical protein